MLLQNFNRPAKEIILSTLNAVNNDDQFTIDTIDISDLRVVNPDTQLVEVTITAAANSDYTGSLPVEYQRINIEQVVGSRGLVMVRNDAVMVSGLVPYINQHFSIQLTADDVVNEIIMRSDFEQPYEQVVQIASTSLIYYGQLRLILL